MLPMNNDIVIKSELPQMMRFILNFYYKEKISFVYMLFRIIIFLIIHPIPDSDFQFPVQPL